MEKEFSKEIKDITSEIIAGYSKGRAIDKVDLFTQPDKTEIIYILDKLFEIVYAGCYRDRSFKIYNIESKLQLIIEDAAFHLNKQIALALRHSREHKEAAQSEIESLSAGLTLSFLKRIPSIREMLEMDLQAAYDGDPATKEKEEIILCYPGFYAITVNRFAHELYLLNVPLIPRIMTEHAHSITGIDIHPGATIGKNFFIDHGTGVVVGETTVIGDNVKLYQGVTLGALSTRGGKSLRGTHRHPTIEDNVTIYAGASILGGETIIGHDSVIGSNVFITYPLPPYSRVSVKNQDLLIKGKKDSDAEVFSKDQTLN